MPPFDCWSWYWYSCWSTKTAHGVIESGRYWAPYQVAAGGHTLPGYNKGWGHIQSVLFAVKGCSSLQRCSLTSLLNMWTGIWHLFYKFSEMYGTTVLPFIFSSFLCRCGCLPFHNGQFGDPSISRSVKRAETSGISYGWPNKFQHIPLTMQRRKIGSWGVFAVVLLWVGAFPGMCCHDSRFMENQWPTVHVKAKRL